ncbi:MAG: hypothetical protein J5977_03625 [Fibrobacter sp.]|nr:hypothetical protein [Fibrobacter sp.]
MDRLEKELEQIIVMEDAGLSLRSLCRIYKEAVLDDESMKDIPLEAKQFAVAESLAKGYCGIARKFGFNEEKFLSGLMSNFMLPLVAALHYIVTRNGERSTDEDNR